MFARAVLMQVDESGGHDLPLGIDRVSGRSHRGPDVYDAPTAHADVPHGIQLRLGIDHPTTDDDDVEQAGWLGVCRRNADQERQPGKGNESIHGGTATEGEKGAPALADYAPYAEPPPFLRPFTPVRAAAALTP